MKKGNLFDDASFPQFLYFDEKYDFFRHMKKGNLFVDASFPPSNKSLYFDEKYEATSDPNSLREKWKHHDITWKRPSEIVTDPQFFVEGGTRFDVNQGMFLLQVTNLLCNYYNGL